jgi:hypothetical protein
MATKSVKRPSPGARRTREWRERRRKNMRRFGIELHQKDFDGLGERSGLSPQARTPDAIVQALYRLLDKEFPWAKWYEARQATAQQSKEDSPRRSAPTP